MSYYKINTTLREEDYIFEKGGDGLPLKETYYHKRWRKECAPQCIYGISSYTFEEHHPLGEVRNIPWVISKRTDLKDHEWGWIDEQGEVWKVVHFTA